MRRVVILLALVALFLGGCAAQVHKRTESLRHDDGPPRIVLMPLDLELSEMSAGGVQQPMAEWTCCVTRLNTPTKPTGRP